MLTPEYFIIFLKLCLKMETSVNSFCIQNTMFAPAVSSPTKFIILHQFLMSTTLFKNFKNVFTKINKYIIYIQYTLRNTRILTVIFCLFELYEFYNLLFFRALHFPMLFAYMFFLHPLMISKLYYNTHSFLSLHFHVSLVLNLKVRK